MSKYKHVTKDEFDRIKHLQAAGLRASKAAEVMGRTTQTISTVYKAEVFVPHTRQRKPQAKKQVELWPSEVSRAEFELLEKRIEALERQSGGGVLWQMHNTLKN